MTTGGPILGVQVNPSYKPVPNEPGHISYQTVTGELCAAVTSNDCGQEMDVTVDDTNTVMTFITSNKADCGNYTAETAADSESALAAKLQVIWGRCLMLEHGTNVATATCCA